MSTAVGMLVPLAAPLAKAGEAGKSGPIGLAIILILCVACYFLFKSMSKHLKRVREDFPKDQPPRLDADADPPVDAPTAAPTSPPAAADEPEA